jgi:hypothetical protein
MDDFAKYEEMRAAGATAEQVCLAAANSGADFAFCVRLLIKVFGLSFGQAKEVYIVANSYAPSLAEYEERFVEPLKEYLTERERADRSSHDS